MFESLAQLLYCKSIGVPFGFSAHIRFLFFCFGRCRRRCCRRCRRHHRRCLFSFTDSCHSMFECSMHLVFCHGSCIYRRLNPEQNLLAACIVIYFTLILWNCYVCSLDHYNDQQITLEWAKRIKLNDKQCMKRYEKLFHFTIWTHISKLKRWRQHRTYKTQEKK